MGPVLQIEHIFIDVSTSNAAMDLNLHEVAKRQANALGLLSQFARWRQYEHLRLPEGQVDLLKGTKGEHARFTGTTLALNDYVTLPDDGEDRPLLNGRWLVEAVCVETYARK